MADRVFCIDFGSAFTKVALRRDPGATAVLVPQPRSGNVEGIDFCFPSVIAVDRRTAKPRVECGEPAAGMRDGNGVSVHRNWKKWLFQYPPPANGQPVKPPLESLLYSDEFRDLADKHNVPRNQVLYLQQLVEAAQGLTGKPLASGGPSDAQWQSFAGKLAVHFFTWLREEVLRGCARLGQTGLKFEEIPVRVAVPAFDGTLADGPNAHPGTAALLDALRKTGWPLHPTRPIVTEPYSNAVGILTHGQNVVHRGRIVFRQMFEKGPFITVLSDASHYASYRVLVVDVGAYTTDLAAVTLDTKGQTIDDPQEAIAIVQHSIPLGVTLLDEQLLSALGSKSEEKAAKLRNATPADWEAFHRLALTEGKAYRKPGLVIGGKDDGELLESTVAAFAKSIADEVAKFCDGLAPAACQELILTGGGNIIPAIRDEVRRAAQSHGHSYVKAHAPDIKRTPGGPPVNKLDETFARGGSAAGGVSVYFEKCFY